MPPVIVLFSLFTKKDLLTVVGAVGTSLFGLFLWWLYGELCTDIIFCLMAWCALTKLVVKHTFELERFEKYISCLEEVTSMGSTPLFFAVIGEQDDVVHFLLNRGANPHAVNNYGETALHWAVSHNKAEYVRLLLAAGANPSHQDGDSLTPIDWAIERGDPGVLQLLQQNSQRRRSFHDRIRLKGR